MPEIVTRFVDVHVYRMRDGMDEWLLLKRAAHVQVPNAWGMVQGHIEQGEKAYETAFREFREETCLEPEAFYQASYVNRFYLAEPDQIILSPVFCARVDSEAEVGLCDEHTEFKWVSHADAMAAYAWPGQRKSLQICRQQFVETQPRAESDIMHLL